MAMRDDLLRLITKYQELTGVSDSWMSNTLFKNGTKLPLFRNGGGMDIAVYEKAIHWFTENWPKGHRKDWPAGVRKVFVCMAIEPASVFIKGTAGETSTVDEEA
jgi:hypothetical protein